MDFVHDAAESGRKFRALSVVDPYTRECLALEVDTSMGSRRVTRVLEAIIAECGVPQAIRSDNGPEFTLRHFLAWCAERKIEVVHIEPVGATPSKIIQVLKQRVSRELRRRMRKRSPAAQLSLRFDGAGNLLPHFWQHRFYDFNAWSHKKRNEKLNYMHMNPVKRGLARDPGSWIWSSHCFYAQCASVLLGMDGFP